MSRKIGMDTICLRPTPRLAHTEYSMEYHTTLALAKTCPGFMWAVGNHIPANVSDEMCTRHVEYLKAHWQRSSQEEDGSGVVTGRPTLLF